MGKVRCIKCGDVLHNDDKLHCLLECNCGNVFYDYHPVWPRIGFKDIHFVEVWDDAKQIWRPMTLGGSDEQVGKKMDRKNKAGTS